MPDDQIGRTGHKTKNRRAIRNDLIGIVNRIITVQCLAKNPAQVPARHPESHEHHHNKCPHGLHAHCQRRGGILFICTGIQAKAIEKAIFQIGQYIKHPQTQRNIQIDKIPKTHNHQIQTHENRREFAPKLNTPKAPWNRRKGRTKIGNDIPEDNTQRETKAGPKQRAVHYGNWEKPLSVILLHHSQWHFHQRVVNALVLNPLLSQNNHCEKAAAIKSRNHSHPPEHGHNPHIPRHGNPARQSFKKPPQGFARGQDRPLWQIGFVIGCPLILGRCQIIRHSKIGDQFPDKIRGHSRANQCHSKHDKKLAPTQLERAQEHERDYDNGKNSGD